MIGGAVVPGYVVVGVAVVGGAVVGVQVSCTFIHKSDIIPPGLLIYTLYTEFLENPGSCCVIICPPANSHGSIDVQPQILIIFNITTDPEPEPELHPGPKLAVSVNICKFQPEPFDNSQSMHTGSNSFPDTSIHEIRSCEPQL